ncbi:MAG: lipid-binding SYLF domain-containing protein [Acidobacteria bacterium]|nr:lipid-binding SYLF domain-containing protein [Acidobacteriota bacterium]
MKLRFSVCLLCALCLSLISNVVAFDKSDAVKQSGKASTVFKEIMDAPDKAVPQNVLDKAVCIAVFPGVIKAGVLGLGGRGGRGVASCRTKSGWSSPAFFDLKGGSLGPQIGVQSTDFVFLFMNDKGLNSLLKSKFEVGGDASVAAGPVGRQAGASTDLRLTAEILSYSRSKGLFAGLELKGAVITLDESDMEAVYGKGVSAESVLKGSKSSADVATYPTTLTRYSKSAK